MPNKPWPLEAIEHALYSVDAESIEELKDRGLYVTFLQFLYETVPWNETTDTYLGVRARAWLDGYKTGFQDA